MNTLFTVRKYLLTEPTKPCPLRYTNIKTQNREREGERAKKFLDG
jgi:hypothetical protein